MKTLFCTGLLLLGLLIPVGADTISIVGNNVSQTLTLNQENDKVDVMGNSNVFVIDAELEKIDLLGNSNHVRVIRRQGRAVPHVSHAGTDNEVTYEDR